MTEVERHPNCRCGARVGDNAYCVIHGRIRNMDAGASPFIDPDAYARDVAASLGIREEDIDRTELLDDTISQMHRDNLERDVENWVGQNLGTEARLPYDADTTAEEITDEDEETS